MTLNRTPSSNQFTIGVHINELSHLRAIITQHIVYLETIIVQPNRSAENIMNIAKSILECQEWLIVLNK